MTDHDEDPPPPPGSSSVAQIAWAARNQARLIVEASKKGQTIIANHHFDGAGDSTVCLYCGARLTMKRVGSGWQVVAFEGEGFCPGVTP